MFISESLSVFQCHHKGIFFPVVMVTQQGVVGNTGVVGEQALVGAEAEVWDVPCLTPVSGSTECEKRKTLRDNKYCKTLHYYK